MGLTRCSVHAPHFAVPQSVVRSSLRCCPCISATSTPKRKALPRSSSKLFVLIMIYQEVDLAAGDFNGTAWRCRSRDNLKIRLMKPLLIVPCLRHGGPTPLWGTRTPSRTTGQTSVYFSNHPALSVSGKVSKHGAFSIPLKTLGLRPNDQECHHETWLHLHFVDWGNKWSNQAYCNGNIRLKEQPGTQKAKYQ